VSQGEKKMEEYERKLRESAIPTVHISGSGRVHQPGLGEISVSGSGSISPEEIRVSGSGHLPGGIEVSRISGSGSISIEGDAKADVMHFSGSAKIAGTVEAKSLSASGSFRAGGNMIGAAMHFSGSCSIGGRAELEDSLLVSGSVEVLEDLKAKNQVEIHGSFNVGGKLTAGIFKAELSQSQSRVEGGIMADYVEVRRGRETGGIVLFGFTIFGRKRRIGRLVTTDIAAKEKAYLENVICDNVTAGEVIIEEGCEIKGEIQYRTNVSVHPSAKLANPPERIT